MVSNEIGMKEAESCKSELADLVIMCRGQKMVFRPSIPSLMV